MSNDLTQKLNGSLEDKVDRLITVVQSMDSRLGSVETRLGSVETHLGSIENRLGSVETHLGSIENRLGSVETKVDQRLRETQPIWEAVQAQLTEVRDSQQRLSEDMQSLREETQRDMQSLREDISVLRADVASLRADTEKGFRTIDRRMERQIGEFEKLHAYQRDLEDRVDKLEKLSSP